MPTKWWQRRRLEAQLPDAIRQFNTTLCAGHSLVSALHQLAQATADPLGSLLKGVLAQHQAGEPLTKALTGLYKNSDCEEMEIFITTLCVGLESGGSIHALLNHAEQIALGKKVLKEKMAVLTAQGRMQGTVTAALPFGLYFILEIINPGYTAPLTQTRLGIVVTVVGCIINLLGLFWIQKISRVQP